MNGGMDGEIGAVGSNLGRYLMSIDKPSPILNNLWDQMGIYTYIYTHNNMGIHIYNIYIHIHTYIITYIYIHTIIYIWNTIF